MLVCPSCKTKAAEWAKFCRKCGRALVPEEAAVPEAIAKRQSFDARISVDPQNPKLLEEYGDFLLSVGLNEEGLIQLHRAAEIDKGNPDLLLKIARVYSAKEDWDNAAKQVRRLIEIRPNDPSLYEKLVDILLSGGRNEEAAEVLEDLAGLVPGDISVLKRLRDLLKGLGKSENLIEVCRAVLKEEAGDIETSTILANTLQALGREEETTEAFTSLLQLNPDDPRANLYLGIARHDTALHDKGSTFDDAISLLEKAVSNKAKLSRQEADVAMLYLVSAQLRGGKVTCTAMLDLEGINPRWLSDERVSLLSQCFALLGDREKKAGHREEAERCLRRSLGVKDNSQANEIMAAIYLENGDDLLSKGKYVLAKLEYDFGLQHLPDDAALKARRDQAISKQKRKNLIKNLVGAAIFLLAGLVAAFWYYGQGAFHIHSSVPANIMLLKGGTPIASIKDRDRLVTSLLRFGRYNLSVEKDGYEPVTKELRVSLGRKTKAVEVALTPIYGTLKVNSDPPGATVELDGVPVGETPLANSQCLAKETKIVLRHKEKGRFARIVRIHPNNEADLGTVSLIPTGIILDSFPTGLCVYSGSTLMGKTPVTLNALDPGPIDVSIKEKGWIWNESITVKEGEVLSVPLALCGFDLTSLPPDVIADPPKTLPGYWCDFLDSREGWSDGSGDWGWKKIHDGVLEFGVINEGNLYWDGPFYEDFWATVRLRFTRSTPDAKACVYFRAYFSAQFHHWYRFSVDQKGNWFLEKSQKHSGDWNLRNDTLAQGCLRDGGASAAWFPLSVECIGDRITLFTDGQKLTSVIDEEAFLPGGHIGFGIDGSKSTIEIDKICHQAIPRAPLQFGEPVYEKSFSSAEGLKGWEFKDVASLVNSSLQMKSDSGWAYQSEGPEMKSRFYCAMMTVKTNDSEKDVCPGLILFGNDRTRQDGNVDVSEVAGLLFAVKPGNGGWWLQADTFGENEWKTLLSGSHRSIYGKTTLVLEARVSGYSIEYLVNGERITVQDLSEHPHPDGLMTGKIGVYVANGTALFDDLTIRPILGALQ